MQVTSLGPAIVQRIGHRIFVEGRWSRQLVIIRTLFCIAALRLMAGAVTAIWPKRVLMVMVLVAVMLSAGRGKPLLAQVAQDAPEATQSAPLTPEALQRLVAPIALYPDALVAQILAASTYPSEIVEADRWLQNQSNPNDEKLAEEVDKQSWDPSVKALTDFPSVLSNLDTNLSWTSALGDAYFNQPQDVLDAVQVLRARAKDAGNLQSNPQQTVMDQGPTIIIQPADPDVCYVPTYNPLLVYGDPIGIYPGYLYDSVVGAPYISFGVGIGIGGGFRRGFGWGFHNWGCNWIGHSVVFNHNIYVSHSPTFFHRLPGGGGGTFGRSPGRPSFPGNNLPGNFDRNRGGGNFDRNRNPGIPKPNPNPNPDRNRGGGNVDRNRNPGIPKPNPNPNPDRNRGGGNVDRKPNQGIPNPNFDRNRGGTVQTPGTMQNRQDFRGFGQPGPNTGTRSGAFSGIAPGGIERSSASRGQSSLGGRGGSGGGGAVRGGAADVAVDMAADGIDDAPHSVVVQNLTQTKGRLQMLRINDHFERFHLGRLLALAAFAIFVSGGFELARAQQPGQKTFASSEAACAALISAVRQNDQSALLQILGPGAKEIISSGDEIEDRNSRLQFMEKYREMHRLVREPDGTITLYVGAENWPMPILLAHTGNRWYFDTLASKAEILFRRIGRNELATIQVCRELVNAQNEYYAEPHDGGVKEFAPRFLSDDGKHNGLYWKISNREPESPVGELLTLANTEDYAKETTKPRPFRGYYYRILKRQGRHAPGGAKNYMVNGEMIGGFAFVAYPAEYRSSGVMTFIVNRDGMVYQKDLGPRTAIRAKTLTEYDPDVTWKKIK